jgi:hypothetical protein
VVDDSRTVVVDLQPLLRFAGAIERGLAHSNGPIQDAFKQWSFRYKTWTKRRYVEHAYGRGHDPWVELSPATIRARRNKKKRLISILWDTGVLLGALDVGVGIESGSLVEDIPFGVRVGYGGPHEHDKSQGITIADLAEIHHEGLGNVPARPIIVKPTQKVINAMARDMALALDKLSGENGSTY